MSWILIFVLLLLYKVVDIWLSVRVMPAHMEFFSEFHGGLETAAEIGLAVAALPTAALLLSSKWTKTRVFIAYNRTRLENAEQIRSGLARYGIDAYLNSPSVDLSHDHLLDRLLRQLNTSDMVIAVPGATQSFVDAEIFSASRSRLPMVVIACTDRDSLPNTMFSGYPTFEFDKLSSNDFVPLGRFCLSAVNHWRFTLASLLEGVKFIGTVWGSPMGKALSVLIVFLSYFAIKLAYAAEMLIGGLLLGIGAIAFMLVISFGMLSARQGSRIIRQKAITGTATFKAIKSLSSGYTKPAVACLKTTPLPFRHGIPGTDLTDMSTGAADTASLPIPE